MSLYNLIHGTNPFAGVLLACLGWDRSCIPRFRDCYWDGEHICVYTRTGGGNRDWYEAQNADNPDGPWNSDLQDHPCYVRDADDEYDNTYATFLFTVPKHLDWVIPHLEADTPPSEKWKIFIDKLHAGDNNDPQVAKVLTAFKPIIAQINKELNNG